jgi:mono/diheme cytochrome c family protein
MSTPQRLVPDAMDAHCLACHGATPARGDALLGRALTVQASKLYARLHYRAELDEADQ